ncbi:MAG: glycoside hydrolase family 25 protein [Lachnospiraceae bacterium]|nr:glycoside hydrolase family 25 protein [Lachnospiraceae bacterium]
MKTSVIIGILIFAITIGGCARKKAVAPKELPLQEESVTSEPITEEPPEDVPFIFRDAFGQEYETTVNPRIASKVYDDAAFVHDGQKLSYEDGEYMLGVDVSHHQGSIDWDRVKADGYDFAFLRIGYRGYGSTGSLNPDKEFENYYRDAKDAGLLIGVYFFAQAINEDEAREEADYVLGILGGRELDLPVVYDPESILDDEARTDDVTGEQFTANTGVFCETIAENGYDAMIYSNMLWEAFELDLEKLSDYPIWYADYEAVPQTPYAFEFWQYSNEGTVSGVEGPCDLDIWIK